MPEYFDFAQIGGKKRRKTGKKGRGKKRKGTRRRRSKSH
jgi:hypothetical protein